VGSLVKPCLLSSPAICSLVLHFFSTVKCVSTSHLFEEKGQVFTVQKKGRLFGFMYFIQHCFISRPSDSTVSEDAGIGPRTVATSALAVRRSIITRLDIIHNSARSHPCTTRRDLIHNSAKSRTSIEKHP
jgi:hypothetical protein